MERSEERCVGLAEDRAEVEGEVEKCQSVVRKQDTTIKSLRESMLEDKELVKRLEVTTI